MLISTTVSDIADPDARSIAIGPFGSSLKAEMYEPSGVAVIRGQNIVSAPQIDEGDLVFVSPETASKFPACLVSEGDLVFPHRGAIGRVGIVGSRPMLLSSSMMKLRCDRTKVDPLFMLYYFRGPGKDQLLMRASTVGTPGIGQPLTSLRGIPLSIPPLVQQQAIAEVLGALDDKIAANAQVARTVESLGSAKFSHLGLDTEPHDAALLLEDLFDLNPRRTTVSATPTVIDMQALPTTTPLVTQWASGLPKGGTRFKNGDTLIARITPCLENRKTTFVDFLKDEEVGIGSTEFIVLRSKHALPLGLSYFMAISPRFRDYAIQNLVGTSGRQRVSSMDLARYNLSSINHSDLHAFGNWADENLKVLGSLRDENNILATTRDALLPQLMSGKLKVKQAEEIVTSAV